MSTASTTRLAGLDSLRLTAALLIFSQHLASVCGQDEWIDVGGFRVGRIGTSLFFALAGFFAATTRRSPLLWLRDRLVFLLPPFWLATATGFVAAAVTGYKPFDLLQVVCQLCAVGYFTHGEAMINVATWFMTPLLLLYGTVTLARLWSVRVVLSTAMTAAILVAVCSTGPAATTACHAITFCAAFLVAGQPEQRRAKLCAALSTACGVLVLSQSEFRYGAISFCLLATAIVTQIRFPSSRSFSGIAYEWFLVHGLCLTLVSTLTHSLIITGLLGVLASIVVAVLLKRTVSLLRHCTTAATRRMEAPAAARERATLATSDQSDERTSADVSEAFGIRRSRIPLTNAAECCVPNSRAISMASSSTTAAGVSV